MKKFLYNIWTVIVLLICCLVIWFFNDVVGFVILIACTAPYLSFLFAGDPDSTRHW